MTSASRRITIFYKFYIELERGANPLKAFFRFEASLWAVVVI